MTGAFLCDAIRIPVGRLNGALSGVRADDLAAIPIKALIDRKAGVDWWRSTRIFDLAQNRQGSDRRYGADGMRANQGLGHAEKPADFVQSDLGAPLTLALSAPFQRDVLEGRGNRVLGRDPRALLFEDRVNAFRARRHFSRASESEVVGQGSM
jgi:hypothetical protein